MVVTYRYRVKDKHAKALERQARAVNFVWNFCNETQRTAVQRGAKWPSAFDLINLMPGTSRELGLLAGTLSQIAQQYVASRRQSHRRLLRFRGRRSLGWVPLRGREIGTDTQTVRVASNDYFLWASRPLPSRERLVDGASFSQDSRDRWYLNLAVETEAGGSAPEGAVGIDLGLKALATLSTGETIEAPQFYRKTQARLGSAQRANRKGQARTLAAKVGNQRRDFLHKHSTRIARSFGLIAVGNVNASGLSRTRMAKSVLDAGWTSFRTQLRYKAIAHGARYVEVNERFTTQTCSECGSLGGPKGREGLRVREWTCQHCGSIHDRDVNAARNILGLGHQAP